MKTLFKKLRPYFVTVTTFLLANILYANTNIKKHETFSNTEIATAIQDFEKTITKDATAEDLKNIEKELSEKGFEIDFSKLAYNGKNEITAITIKYKGQNNNEGVYSVKSGKPINTIVISAKNGSVSLRTVGNNGNSTIISQGTTIDSDLTENEMDEHFEKSRQEMAARREASKAAMKERENAMKTKMEERKKDMEADDAKFLEKQNAEKEVSYAPEDIVARQYNQKKAEKFYQHNGSKTAIYIVNKEEISKDEMMDIDPLTIESVNILKDKTATDVYGEKGKNGAIVITTKKESKEFYGDSKLKPSIIMVNGIEVTESEMKSIEPSRIESMNVIKEKNAIALYGEKGKNGAIIITTKKE